METFAINMNNKLLDNQRINEMYWTSGLYKDGCSDKKIHSVFENYCDYITYHKSMMHKVENASKKNGVSKSAIIKEILKSRLYRNVFAKDPIRQKTHEHTQFNNMCIAVAELKHEFNNVGFHFYDNEKHNKYVVDENGKLVSKIKKYSNPYKESKMFDFVLEMTKNGKKHIVFFDNKVTNGNGGSQDNTGREMQTTHKYCSKNTDPNVYFCFILDGDFWKHKKANITTNKNILRCDACNFKETIIQLMHDINII